MPKYLVFSNPYFRICTEYFKIHIEYFRIHAGKEIVYLPTDTYKTNKRMAMVRPSPLRCLSQIQKSGERKESVFFSQECLTFYDATPSSFIQEGHCSLFMGSKRFPLETKGEGGALFACYDLFFPLYSQISF